MRNIYINQFSISTSSIQATFKFNITAVLLFLILLSGVLTTANFASAQSRNIKNDIFWKTTDGLPLNSQGGGVFKFPDPSSGKPTYFWYGVHYEEADQYRKAPHITKTTSTFEAVTCYSSTDLVNWKFEANVLGKDSVNKSGKTWVGRLGVAYIQQMKKYAMFVQHGDQVLITLSDSPTGEFKWHQQISMEQMIGTSNTGDQTVFTDEDTGKSYLIYSYGRGRNKIYVSEIGIKNGKVDLLDCTKIFQGESREGNCMFKYQNKYYMCASNIYGWDASFAYYLVADDIRGPYLPVNKMLEMNGANEDFAHVSQTGFFYTIKVGNKETVVYCGDRWSDFAGNGLGYNQWCPISFDGNTPYFNSLSSWNLDEKTGDWTVATDNNYVRNGSFEADRRKIPSHFKPVQEQLTGWVTVVGKGNPIGLDSLNSPVLNHFNTTAEREVVIGEKSLNISDKIAFNRKVYQMVTSSGHVKLKDGLYELSAKVKHSTGFNTLEIYALSNSKKFAYQVKHINAEWQTVTVKNVRVRGGKVEVGFLADGHANAYCLIDDVSLKLL
jgi:hypothetical protein